MSARGIRRNVARSPFSYGALLTAARALPVITVFAASYALSANSFGALAVLITSITVATLIADSGTDNAAGWLASRATSPRAKREVLASLAYTRVTVAAVATVLLVVPQLHDVVEGRVAAWAVLVLAVIGNTLAAYNAARRVRLRIDGAGEPAALLAEKLGVSCVFGVSLIVLPTDATWIVFGYLAACIVGPALAFRPQSRESLRASRASTWALLRHAAPFIVTTLASAVIWRASTFVLAHFDHLDQAGFLTLAYLPVQALVSIPNLAAPLLLIKGHRAAESAESTARTAVAFGAFLGVAGIVAVEVLQLVTGDAVLHPQAADALQVFLLAMPLLWLNPILIARVRLTLGPWAPTATQALIAALAVGAALLILPQGTAVDAAAIVAFAEVAIVLSLSALMRRKAG